MRDGIIICAGGERLSREANAAIVHLRKVGCQLPIELWKMPGEHLGVPNRPGVSVNELAAPGGWELKALALEATHLDRVLLLDADTLCAADPAPLFNELPRLGAIFWPGGAAVPESSPAWQMLGLTPRRVLALDSAQMLVDRNRCAAAVAKCAEMNRDSSKWYKYVYGDKDTFLMAWLATSTPYHLVPAWPKVAQPGYWQHDLRGNPLFRHADGIKRPSSAHAAYEGIAQKELPGALARTKHNLGGRHGRSG